MGEELLLAAVLLLALYGCSTLIERLTSWAFRRKQRPETLLVPVSGHREDLEYLVRAKLDHLRKNGGGTLILVDMGLDDETRAVAQRLCEQENVALCPVEEVDAALRKRL